MVMLQSTPASILQQMLQADQDVMLFFNVYLAHPLLDDVALFIREPLFHLPLYLFVILLTFQRLGKRTWWWLLIGIGLIALSDILSSHFIKDYVGRPRPCRDPFMAHHIRFIAKYCGANGSFTSSHAVNHFAFATYVVLTLGSTSSLYKLFFLWAGMICYAQVYVGVHYPSDVVAGALLGILFGWSGARFAAQALSLQHNRL